MCFAIVDDFIEIMAQLKENRKNSLLKEYLMIAQWNLVIIIFEYSYCQTINNVSKRKLNYFKYILKIVHLEYINYSLVINIFWNYKIMKKQ